MSEKGDSISGRQRHEEWSECRETKYGQVPRSKSEPEEGEKDRLIGYGQRIIRDMTSALNSKLVVFLHCVGLFLVAITM